MAAAKRRNLIIAGVSAAAAVCAAYDLWLWLTNFTADPFHNDFTFYYAASRLGLTHGWARLYDLSLLQQQLDAIGSGIHVAQLARYVSPPPLAWLVVPLTALPFPVAYWAWSAILGAALWLSWRLAAPGEGRLRVIYLVAAVGWLPVIYGLQLGQPALLVAVGVAGSYALLRRNHQLAAGAVLCVLVFKPQVAVLVPAALLVTGRWRAFAGTVVVLALLGIASALSLGSEGVTTYLDKLRFASTLPESQAQTLAAWLPNLQVARVVQIVIAVWTLALAYRLRARGLELTLALALAGGLAASPYVHYDDLTMLGLAGLFYLRAPHPRLSWMYVLALVIAAEGFPVWRAGPVLAGELGALVLLSMAVAGEHGKRSEPIDQRAGAGLEQKA